MKKLVSVLLMLALLCGGAVAFAATVTLEPNGGTGESITVSVNNGEAYSLPECSFTAPNGYEFYAWMVYNAGNELIDVSDPGAEWRPGNDMTFRAAWVEKGAPTYTLTFDANGGSGTVDSVTTRRGMAIMLPPAKVFTAPAGKVFKNWDINGQEYRAAGMVENVQSNLKVVAEWMTEGATLYTVSFDGGNGTGTTPTATVESGEWYTIPECGFTAPVGYEFYGWEYYRTDGTLSTVTGPGDSWRITRNMEFKAAWVEKDAPTYTLTFDLNGGTGDVPSVTTRRGMAIQLPPSEAVTAPSGSLFKHWDVNGTAYGSAALVNNVQSNLAVKAIWESCEHSKDKTVSTTDSTKSYTSTAEGHVGSYTHTTVYHCNKCDSDFSESETITEAQAAHTFSGNVCSICKYTCSHSYVDGVCSVCGHTCDHTGAAHNGTGTSKLTSFVDHRDGTHTRTFEVWHNYECPTCKHVFEKYIEMGTATEPHKYENGTCHVCGAKPACETHEKSSKAGETDSEKTYKSEDATQHYAEFERTTLYNCDVCGWQFSETLKLATQLENHNFEEGVCSVCGHICAHEYEEGAMFCTYCKMQAPTRVDQKPVEEALEAMKPEVKEALADVGLDTAEAITEKLTESVPKDVYVEEQIQVVDVALEIQVVNEAGDKEWVEVTPQNFPTEGLEVTFAPPAGTNVNDYNFVVVHMFTSPEKAGQVEVLTPIIRDGKLVVTFTSLSPVSISWKAKPQTGVALPQTGDDSMLLVWVALLAISCTALFARKRSRA